MKKTTTTLKEIPKRAAAAERTLERYMTVAECAEFVRQSQAAIRLHLTKGTLRRFKFCGRTLIKASDAESLIREA